MVVFFPGWVATGRPPPTRTTPLRPLALSFPSPLESSHTPRVDPPEYLRNLRNKQVEISRASRMSGRPPDDAATARRLFGTAQPQTVRFSGIDSQPPPQQHTMQFTGVSTLPQQQPYLETIPRTALPPMGTPVVANDTAPDSAAEEEAEAALRHLEAEWAMRMEAPLSALANLEESLTRQLEHMHRRLPPPLGVPPP